MCPEILPLDFGVKATGDSRPIGVFDSGIGGLTVLKEIWRVLPNENTIYFGDCGRTPYGSKSHDTIVTYSLQILRFLLSQNVKMIVIACNSASAHAYEAVKANSPVPVVEVISPGAALAAKESTSGRIGIIATRATVNSGIYKAAVHREVERLKIKGQLDFDENQLLVEQTPCPLFVSLAEEGWWDHPIAELTAREYLQPLLEQNIDTLVLGCTHYPLLSHTLSKVCGDSVKLVNSGAAVAEVVKATLTQGGLLRFDLSDQEKPWQKFYSSDEPRLFSEVMATFLGENWERPVTQVRIEEYATRIES